MDEEGRRATCPAAEGSRFGTYRISFPAGVVSAGAQPDPSRRLLQRGSSGRGGDGSGDGFTVEYDGCGPWEGGYDVCSAREDRTEYVDLTDANELPRWLGGAKGANRVMGGLVLNQVRSPMDPGACSSKHRGLSAKCAKKLFFER